MKMTLAITTLIFSLQVQSFTLIGSTGNRGFADANITININQASCPNSLSLRRLVEDSIKAWNGVSTSKLNLIVGEETTATSSTMPPTAYCDSSISGSTLGQGGHTLGSDGHITTGFLRLNTNASTTGYILNQNEVQQKVVVAHEIGHMFGLGHTEKEYSLMHYSIGTKTELGLAQDDIDGINFLYPRNELGGDKILGGCGTITTNIRPPNQLPPINQVFAFLFWLIIPIIALYTLMTRIANEN